MLEIFKLVGRVLVDSSDADQSLDATGKKAEDTTGAIGEYAQKLQNWAAGLLTVSSVVAGLKKVWEVSSQVAELGDTIDKSSQKFLLSRAAYQEWAFVAEHSGFSIEQLGNAVVDLSKKVGEGTDDTNAALEELGISIADAATATPEDLFDMVITALQQMDNSTRRAYLADRLLGGAAKDLGPLLEANADDTQKLKDRMYELGGAMSDTLIDKSAEYEDATTDLKTAWRGVKNDLAEETVPAMTEIVDGLTEMLTGDFVDGLKTAADGVADYLDAVLSNMTDWATKARLSIRDALGFDLFAAADVPLFNPFATAEKVEETSQNRTAFSDAISYGTTGKAPDQSWGGFWNSLRDSFSSGAWWDNLLGRSSTPTMDELVRSYGYYVGNGGTSDDFMTELWRTYGKDVQEQFSEYMEQNQTEVADATKAYTDSMDTAAEGWNQATQDYAAANSAAVERINSAAQSFENAAAHLYGSMGSSVYGNAASSLYGRHAHANGIPFVPRDNYPSQLHYGERVLTRQENEKYSRGAGKGGATNINIQTVAQSPAQTAAAITAALARARWSM